MKEVQPAEELSHVQEALLKKRKRDDMDQRRRIDARAKQKLSQAQQKKEQLKEQTGKKILMPEVFASNRMKQHRNFVHYKRNKAKISLAKKAHAKLNSAQPFFASASLHEQQRQIKPNSLLLVVRLKGLNESTSPQAQKILSEFGLNQINNAVFLRADAATLEQLLVVEDYVTYGTPKKQLVNELVRKRGFLRKGSKKEPITNNVLIEELFAEFNSQAQNPLATCICIEDLVSHI
jgi:ribosomal protein L30/L7E